MTIENAGPTFHARKMKLGSAWYVFIDWPGRLAERIKGFPSEAAAEDWIARKSIEWLKKGKVKWLKAEN